MRDGEPTTVSRADQPALDGVAPLPALQRAVGRGFVRVRVVEERTRIERLHQSGCVKLRFPRTVGSGLEAVLINSSGGLTGGDRLEQGFALAAGSQLSVTSQACERVYRALSDEARVATSLELSGGADLAYVPQETILFDGAALSRRLDVSFPGSARVLLCESVILGRTLMGERVETGALHDRWRIRRDGRLVFADDLRLQGRVAAIAARNAALGGVPAFSTVLLVGEDASALLDEAREIVGASGGVSAFDGLLVARLFAPSGFDLRKRLVPLLNRLAKRPLPLVWSI